MIYLFAGLLALAFLLFVITVWRVVILAEVDLTKLYPGYAVDVKHFADFEKRLQILTTVVVISDRIDEPKNILEAAVIDNFREGVNYHFFVPPQIYEKSKDTVFKFFNHLSKSAQLKGEKYEDCGIGQAFAHDLNYSRADYPYVFYLYGDGVGEIKHVLGFRGCDQFVGVSKKYVMIENETAKSILLSTRAGQQGTAEMQWQDELDKLDYKTKISKKSLEPKSKVTKLDDHRKSA